MNEMMTKVKAVPIDKTISGYNFGYIFRGRRVYTEFEPKRYMRVLSWLRPVPVEKLV